MPTIGGIANFHEIRYLNQATTITINRFINLLLQSILGLQHVKIVVTFDLVCFFFIFKNVF